MSAAKTVGIIGGLGPAATVDFFNRLVTRTDAFRDQEHLRVLIDSNPHIPDRNAALAGEGPSPGPALTEAARGLERGGADVIVMACNSAHAWEDEIRAAISVPFLSMVGETASATAELGSKKAGVLAADAAVRAGLYPKALKQRGVEAVTLSPESQVSFMELVYRIKSGDMGATVRRAMGILAQRLVMQGADVVIAGCTEIPLVLTEDDIEAELVSSTDVLVDRVIRFAGAKLRD